MINTLKSILQQEDILEKEDLHILDKMKAFVSSEDVSAFPAAKQLLNLIEKRAVRIMFLPAKSPSTHTLGIVQNEGTNLKSMINTNLAPPPPPIVPKSSKKLRLTDVDPLELARQLTIMESQLYQRIKPMECLQRAREQKTENMDNIAVVIQTSNKVSYTHQLEMCDISN